MRTIIQLFIVTMIISLIAGCEKDSVTAISPDEDPLDAPLLADLPENLPETVFLNEVDSTEAEPAEGIGLRSGSGRYQVRAYLYCYRPSDNNYLNTKDEVYFKRTSIYYPKTGPFRNRVWDWSSTLKRRGNPDIWEMGKNYGRNITVFDSYDPLVPFFSLGRMYSNDKATVTLTVSEQDNAQFAGLWQVIRAVSTAALSAAGPMIGVYSGSNYATMKADIDKGVRDAYLSMGREGDEILGTVQFGLARKSPYISAMTLTSQPLKNAIKINSGTNWEEYLLTGARASYKLRLYLVRI